MKISLLSLFLLPKIALLAQNIDTIRIARTIPEAEIIAPLRFLASDKLKGRHIGLVEIDTAAAFIADQFRKAGAKPLPGANGYFQIFNVVFNRSDRTFYHDPQAAANLPIDASTKGINLKNVVSFVQGTDPRLRNQYVVLSAHYDHEGVADSAVMEDGKMDSIYNGARDNATGTAAVIAAAKYFGRYPPRRSIIFICYTAEEEDLVGSNYYANHPLIPLNHTVYNLNVDNASYNTTHAICLFGLYRTGEDSLFYRTSKAYGLAVLDDPTDGELFDRSDNVSLSQKGIPSATFSMGMTSWDNSIMNRYHRLSDEVGNMDLEYVVRFIRAYILTAKYIANEPHQPKWVKDDPYEKEWQALFKQYK
jgi:Zn-dependent M28 family amino/carboxypeptidase